MKKTFWIRVFYSQSDNLRSKIQNRKWAGIAALAIAFAMCGAVAEAQQTKIPRIGYLTGSGSDSNTAFRTAFLQGLRDLGYIEGKNVLLEYQIGRASCRERV